MDDWEDVRSDLGDKVVDALVAAVSGAKEDLDTYRAGMPGFAYEQSGRGLASWIHDRMWQHLQRALFDVPGVLLFEQGPTREVVVGIEYRLRLKRHSADGMIRNYRTPTALTFWEADNFTLPGLEETRLCFGYVWNDDVEQMGEPVMSRRSSQDKVLWMVRLDERGGAGGTSPTSVEPIVPPSAPALPRVDIPRPNETDGTASE